MANKQDFEFYFGLSGSLLSIFPMFILSYNVLSTYLPEEIFIVEQTGRSNLVIVAMIASLMISIGIGALLSAFGGFCSWWMEGPKK